MPAIIIDGKAIAAKEKEEILVRCEILKTRGIVPCLAVVLVGEDPASVTYVRAKRRALAGLGMESRDHSLSASCGEEELLSLISALNADRKVHGILVQLPLPGHINEERIIAAIDPAKDVDCFHPVSLGNLVRGGEGFLPCTPRGILTLIKAYGIPTEGKHAVVVGRSNIVGKPLALLLSRREINATVTLCHTGTRDLASYTRRADILVSAAGQRGLIRGDMIKEGAALIDVGMNRFFDASLGKQRLTGDVMTDEALEKAGWITPVPGGVGPMTIATLTRNVLIAAERLGAGE